MGQICIRFDQKTENKLRVNAKKRDITVADYLRHLIDLGLQVEEASQIKNSDDNSEKLYKELQLKSYKSAIESLLITRQIYASINNGSGQKPEEILKNLSDKAQAYIESVLGKNI